MAEVLHHFSSLFPKNFRGQHIGVLTPKKGV
jgi:hypothetical protein